MYVRAVKKNGNSHYLPCIVMAHANQTAVNFKDETMTLYGGAQFAKQLVEEGETIFLNITPPKPSIPGRSYAAVGPNIHAYLNQSGGCFSGRSPVVMADGSLRRLDSLVKGDKVLGGHSVVVLIKYTGFSGHLVRFGDYSFSSDQSGRRKELAVPYKRSRTGFSICIQWACVQFGFGERWGLCYSGRHSMCDVGAWP